MNAGEVLNALLIILYKRYIENEAVREFGVTPWNLTEDSDLPLEDAGDSLVICQRLIDRGWARIMSWKKRGKMLAPWDPMTITEAGIDKAEELLTSPKFKFLKDIYTATIEGIVRGLKG
jgi:hypothetical protein